MRRALSVILCFGQLLLFAGRTAAMEAEAILSGLPHNWSGQFRWNDSDTLQVVEVSLGEPHLTADGAVVAEGMGAYLTNGRITKIDVTWRVDPSDLRFEMWEHDAKGAGASQFITDGSHVGQVSLDFCRVKATWTTEPSGDQGTLLLTADICRDQFYASSDYGRSRGPS